MPDIAHSLTIAGEAWALAAVLMAVCWIAHLALRNAAVVDVGWAASLPLICAFYAWRLDGGPRAWWLTAAVAVWGLRLAGYLLVVRILGHAEEGRYVEMRRAWKTHVSARFFQLFQTEALVAVVLSLPFLLVARLGGRPGAIEDVALVVWLVAIAGEITADAQLARFKRAPSNRGRVCDVGWWRYSRHPNYFFEFLIWIAYALYALGSAWGWLGATSPALILYFLFRVTGIPLTEAQALRSRGEAYRRYQRTTSVFVPWFRRSP